MDLLCLGRTNKAFRALVMHRSTKSVWKDSFALVDGVPACPEDISEPEWANLLFDGLC